MIMAVAVTVGGAANAVEVGEGVDLALAVVVRKRARNPVQELGLVAALVLPVVVLVGAVLVQRPGSSGALAAV